MNKDHLKRVIAFEIKNARMRAGLTQEDVLRETGIHVGRIEMGKYSIDICTFFKLCVFLDVDIQNVISEFQEKIKKLTDL